MESSDNIGQAFGVNPHRVDTLLDRARKCYAFASNVSEYIRLMELEPFHHEGERHLMLYFLGTLRGAHGLIGALGKIGWWQRLTFIFSPQKLRIG